MNKFKKILCLIAVFILTSLSVAGCALFERDVAYYNNIVVATVGTDIKITKKQLMNGYESFGYRYVQENGLSVARAMEETLDVLIDREIMVRLSIDMFSGLDEETKVEAYKNPYLALNANEKAQARKTAFEALDTAIKEAEDTIREDHKVSDKVLGEEKTSAPTGTVHDTYKAYDHYIYHTKGEIFSQKVYNLNLSSYEKIENYSDVPEVWTQKIRDASNKNEMSIAKEAKDCLVRILRTNEKGLKFENDEAEDVINREIERIRNEEAKSILAQKFRSCFEQGINKPIDRDSTHYKNLVSDLGESEAYAAAVAELNGGFVQELVNDAVNYYKRQVGVQYDRYKKGLDTDESLGQKIIESLDGIYYLPKSVTDKYFTVSHILVSYTDEQKEQLAEIEEDKNNGGNLVDYKNKLDALRANTGGYKRNESGEEQEWMSVQRILQYIEGYVLPNDMTRSVEEKRVLFRDCIYMFNTDPGMVNPEFEYVIGVENSKMVEPFNEASRKLFGYEMEEYIENGIKTKKLEKKHDGKLGSISGLVWTDYGAHIIMYTRNLDEFIFSNSITQLENTFDKYLFATQTSYTNKTVFDSVLDKITKPAYDTYEASLIAGYKQIAGNKITIKKGNYRDLLK